MRRRCRVPAVQQGETRFFQTQDEGEALAMLLPKPLPAESERTLAGQSEPDNPLHAPHALNAYWQKGDLVIVVADEQSPNGVRFRRQKAEHSCFVKLADLESPFVEMRKLNSMPQVRKALIEGEWMRICLNGRDELKVLCKWVHERGIKTYEGVVSPVLRYMVDNHVKPSVPRPVWLDIEVDSRLSFNKQIAGESRVLCWSLVDRQAELVTKGMLNEDTDEDEKRLLLELWEAVEHFDQVIAWGGDRYDFPVVKARSTKYDLLQSTVRDWRRWLWLDHLELFKRMNMNVSESGDEKQSFKLNVIAQTVLGTGKEDFDSSKTWEAWVAGGDERARLMRYNITDTRLMPQIEQVTGYIQLLQTVADTCGTFPDSRGSQPGVQVEGFLAKLAAERGYKFPTVLKAASDAQEVDQYLGAYVLHPEKNAGIHRDVHVADFAALYPSIIRTWNMSPETIAGQDLPATVPTCYSSLTGHSFRTDQPGILPEAVKQLMELRAKWNKLKASLPPGTEEWKEADRRAGAYKIATNSFYGVIGSPFSRFYDRRVAESITQCGKWLIVETIRAAERRGMKVIYGDTDSLFVVGATRSQFEEFVTWTNEGLYPGILREQGCTENVVKLAYEKQFDRLIISTAKKYLGNFVHYKGAAATADSTPEIKGLEYKRGDTLRVARQMQEEVAHLLVGYKQPPSDRAFDYEAIIDRWMDHVLQDELPLDEVLVSKRVNKVLEDYKTPSNALVRIARELEARGQDVGEGAKIDYVVVDASISPQAVIPAQDYVPGETHIDRAALWDKLVWPATHRILMAAFPAHPWARCGSLVKARKGLEKQLAKERKELERQASKVAAKVVAELPVTPLQYTRRRRLAG